MSGSACNAYQIRKIYAIGGALGMVKRGEDDDLLHELVNGMTGKTLSLIHISEPTRP